MRHVDITPISNAAKMPYTSGVFMHKDLQVLEVVNAICRVIIDSIGYSSSTAYVLFGCANSGSGSNYIISTGAVFFNGEIYLVPAATFTISGPNVAVATIVTVPYTGDGTNADPLTFTDGNTHDVLDIIQMTIAPGLSGSGAANYLAFDVITLVQASQVLVKGSTTTFTPVLSTDPVNKAYADSLVPSGIKPILSGNENVGDISTSTTVTISLGTTLSNNNYKVVLTLISQGTPVQDATVIMAAYGRTTTQFQVELREFAGDVQNVSFDWILFQ